MKRTFFSLRLTICLCLSCVTTSWAQSTKQLFPTFLSWEVRSTNTQQTLRDRYLRAGRVRDATVDQCRSMLQFDLSSLERSAQLEDATLQLTATQTRHLKSDLTVEIWLVTEPVAKLSFWGRIDEMMHKAVLAGTVDIPAKITTPLPINIPISDEAIKQLQISDQTITFILTINGTFAKDHFGMVWFESERSEAQASRPQLQLNITGKPIAVSTPKPATKVDAYMIHARDFQFYGGWDATHHRQGKPLGVKAVEPGVVVDDALTVIQIPRADRYHIWTRSPDYDTQPSSRLYMLNIDGQPMDQHSGKHGHVGMKWEKVGTRELSAGQHVLSLKDTAHFYARCDAILLTSTSMDPNSQTMESLKSYTIEPIKVQATMPKQTSLQMPGIKLQPDDPQIAQLRGKDVTLVFYQSQDAQGKPVIRRQTLLNIDGKTVVLPLLPEGEKLFVQFDPHANINLSTFYPSWDSENSKVTIQVEGKKYDVAGEPRNPYLAGKTRLLIPRKVISVSDGQVVLGYETADGQQVQGTWHMTADRRDASFSVVMQVKQAGSYSMGFAAFDGFNRNAISAVQLPPVFQMQRVPNQAQMVLSCVTPHPLAMVTVPINHVDTPVSYAVVADPQRLPFEWARSDNARYGFTLLNDQNQVQPVAFGPVLGMQDSKFKAGDELKMSWRLLAYPGNWGDALAYSSDHIMQVTDYRKPYRASLTDAALRMIKLMRDPLHSGWDDQLKGFYNIEMPGGVTQASPLMVMATAKLTRDENFYWERALPTLEYLLSRDSFHFTVQIPKRDRSPLAESETQMHVPCRRFGSNVWLGMHNLLGKHNPWIKTLAFEDGKPRYISNAYPKFQQDWAVWQLDTERYTRDESLASTDQFIEAKVYGRDTTVRGIQPHYNVTMHPHWWTLLDMYDRTNDPKYLKASEDAAWHTIAGIWSQPPIPDREIMIHPDGQFKGAISTSLIWKGWDKYATGYPRKPGDTPAHLVPAWLVSQVGLGLEQPGTLYASDGNMHQVFMVSWAGHLLRMADRTGKEIFRTYARNSIMGRWSNWPGYYLNGYTDLFHDPEYPSKGPDVTRMYYHQLPVHLALTLDFLVAEMENRSGHRIAFPWETQEGYAQFTNRIYGAAPGTIFGDDTANLWFNPDLVDLKDINVNYLTARGQDKLWVVLMNEIDKPITIEMGINHQLAQSDPNTSWMLFNADGSSDKHPTPINQTQITIPGRGLIAVALPAHKQMPETIPTLPDNSHVVQKLPDPWGDLHAFRIRSPFGKDSLYVVTTGRPPAGSRAQIHLENHAYLRREVREYPYEMSVYPWSMDQPMAFTFVGIGPDDQVVESSRVVLPGSTE